MSLKTKTTKKNNRKPTILLLPVGMLSLFESCSDQQVQGTAQKQGSLSPAIQRPATSVQEAPRDRRPGAHRQDQWRRRAGTVPSLLHHGQLRPNGTRQTTGLSATITLHHHLTCDPPLTPTPPPTTSSAPPPPPTESTSRHRASLCVSPICLSFAALSVFPRLFLSFPYCLSVCLSRLPQSPLCVCLSPRLCLSLTVCLSLTHTPIISLCLSVSPPLCLSLTVCLSLPPPPPRSVFPLLSLHLFVFPLLSVCPPLCLSLTVCLSTSSSFPYCLSFPYYLSVSPPLCLSSPYCLSVSLPLSIFPLLSVSLSLPLSVYLPLIVCLSVSLSPPLYLPLIVCLSLSPSLFIFPLLSVSLSLPLSVYLSLTVSHAHPNHLCVCASRFLRPGLTVSAPKSSSQRRAVSTQKMSPSRPGLGPLCPIWASNPKSLDSRAHSLTARPRYQCRALP